MGDLARVIKTDPAFVGRLIKAANGLVGYNRRAIVSVQEALMVFGLLAVRTFLALGFSLLSSYRDGNCKSFDYGRYWTGCLVYALAMAAITQRTRVAAAEETFCLGLLVRIGGLALATLYLRTTAKCCSKLWNTGTPLVALEQRAFALNHRELASAMLADWGLPRIFYEPAYFAEVPWKRRAMQMARGSLSLHILCIWLRLWPRSFLAEEAERPGLDEPPLRNRHATLPRRDNG